MQPQQPRLHWSVGELENAELVAILMAFDVGLMIVVAPDDIHEDKCAEKKGFKISNIRISYKVENIEEDSLDSIPSPSPSVKIQIIIVKVYLR